MSADDYTLAVEAGPKGVSIFLSDVSAFFRSELAAGGGELVLPRFPVKLFIAAFDDAAGRVEAFEETDRAQRREADIARAEIARLQQRQTLSSCRLVDPAPRGVVVPYPPLVVVSSRLHGVDGEGGAA
jgi:hypothetical protein